ncbi:hypothetical protein GOV14_04760 [Candidatus Pacearchaeota archaeon]|nr:hypothetical protein [Candidatus Pacearchaeota archaeon]
MEKAKIQNILIGAVFIIAGIIFILTGEIRPYSYFIWNISDEGTVILIGLFLVIAGAFLLLYQIKKIKIFYIVLFIIFLSAGIFWYANIKFCKERPHELNIGQVEMSSGVENSLQFVLPDKEIYAFSIRISSLYEKEVFDTQYIGDLEICLLATDDFKNYYEKCYNKENIQYANWHDPSNSIALFIGGSAFQNFHKGKNVRLNIKIKQEDIEMNDEATLYAHYLICR